MRGARIAILLVASGLVFGVAAAGEKAKKVGETYPGLVPGALTHALIGELPKGVLLKAGSVQVTARDLKADIDKAPGPLREQMKKNAPFVLEQMVAGKLLLGAARKSAAAKKLDVSKESDNDIVRDYMNAAVSAVKVTKKEVKEFYDKNAALCGGAPFEKVEKDLEKYVLRQKRDEAARAHVRTLGQRMTITVSASWLTEQIPLSRDNPIDQARSGGKPTLVDFGGKSCCGPDRMVPVLEAVKGEMKDKVTVVYIEARDHPILAGRYGVRSIPAQVFFDKAGKEVKRHNGLMDEEEIKKQFRAMGVK